MFIYKRKSILLLLVIYLSACSPTVLQEPDKLIKFDETLPSSHVSETESLVENCISPPETFAYSTVPQDASSHFEEILPLAPWQLITTIEEDYDHVEISGIRIYSKYQEIWFKVRQHRKFLIFTPNLQEWDEVQFGLGNRMHIEELFFLSNGSVFGVPNIGDIYETEEIFVLSKYNEDTSSFEYINALRDIPVSSAMQVLFDSQRELFWFIVPGDVIYSFDPESYEVEKFTEILREDILDIVEAKISKSGTIYMLSNTGSASINSDGVWLLKFNPTSGLIERFAISLAPWPLATNLFIDQSERVWFGAVGWVDPDGTWYQMLPSPIFVTNTARFSGLEYRWKSPTIELESNDGRLWLKSYNGMVWLDPDKEEICWFTTWNSNIFEDSDGDLWMVADNSLYKLPISE